MTQQEQNTLAADNLIRQAMQENDLRKAHMLIDAAYRLDNTVPADCYKETCTNKWISAQAKLRPAERQQVGFILE
jgi:hypothetical protein